MLLYQMGGLSIPVPYMASEQIGPDTIRSYGSRVGVCIPWATVCVPLSGLLFFYPPLHPMNTRKWSHMLRRVEIGESWDLSQCLACRSSCPVTGFVPGAGSRSVPTNEAAG